jgi:DNA-binding transcriptional LysR family regulator
MQNRRIIDSLLREAGPLDEAAPTLESNSMILLFSHVRTGRWASVMPAILAETLGLTGAVRAIPIIAPSAVHTVGLVIPNRDPMPPVTAAFVAEAYKVAEELDVDLT